MALLRGSQDDLRNQRATVDTGTGEKRLGDGQRAAHLSRGNFVNFYEDLGISATPEGAKKIRAEEAKFQQQVKKQQGMLNKASQELAGAKGQLDSEYSKFKGQKIPGYDEAMKKAWSQAKKGFVPIRVVDPSGDKIEATYYLPREAVGQLAKATAGFEQRFVDDGKNYNISVKHKSGRIRGQEIHDALRNASQNVYGQFVKSASPSISKQIQKATGMKAEGQAQFDKYYGDLAGKEAQVAGAQTVLQGTKSQRAKMWEDARKNYRNRLSVMSEIYKNLKVG